MKKIFLIFAIFFVSTALLYFYNKNKNGYETYKLEKKEVVKSIYASGYIDSENSVIVKSEVSGYVEKIYVKENDQVKKGQIIAKISNPTLYENLKDIEFQAQLVKQKLSENSDFRKQFIENIEMKKANYENLLKVYERRKNLFEKGLIPKEQFDEVAKNLEVAKRDYEKAVASYQDSLKELSYQLKSFEAKKAEVAKEIDKYYIKSPTDGKVLRKFVNEGDYINNISQNNQLFAIGSLDKRETVLLVDEEYAPLLKEGMEVLVKLDSYPDKVFTGKIKTIESQSDKNSRTVKVKADVNYDRPVLLNMTVESNIILGKVSGLFIPENAYKNGYVKLLENGEIKNVKVEVDKEKYNGYLKALSGLNEGQIIVIGK
ncbi:MAG TPA: efflux transporter periplasmic adaptor subunit [Sulfurihydrogenibium sp.]|uniref:efflux RND transporter periplasmic adaptor subunit n=1 Tax=Sulfurihydrogenibium sp. (strain YO3AOP1) TaxID=436114 RepID=UPI00017232A1|nr:efflux RND transporter periplasmic adaptor subunit [Sulfurihydrogenibium sp. YO3AOP1]ACD66464.1 efflux transporter, RND family, MFP subunit [Sulfurihydrogenibium sp. YO3AOP1]HBT98548.1 efflux transporter periplasmic adaptor subunit [Sulfurihydrogenibium sp.]